MHRLRVVSHVQRACSGAGWMARDAVLRTVTPRTAPALSFPTAPHAGARTIPPVCHHTTTVGSTPPQLVADDLTAPSWWAAAASASGHHLSHALARAPTPSLAAGVAQLRRTLASRRAGIAIATASSQARRRSVGTTIAAGSGGGSGPGLKRAGPGRPPLLVAAASTVAAPLPPLTSSERVGLAATLSAALARFATERQFGPAAETWQTMREERLTPTTAAVNAWLTLLVGAGKCAEALSLWEVMSGEHQAQADEGTLVLLLRACTATDDFPRAQRLWLALTTVQPGWLGGTLPRRIGDGGAGGCRPAALITPGLPAYNAYAEAAARAGMRSEALHVLDRLRRAGLRPDESTFGYAMAACGYSDRADTALTLLDEMRKMGVTPTEATYFTLMTVAGNDGNVDMAREVVAAMHNDGIPPSPRITAAVAHAASQAGSLTRSYQWLQELRAARTAIPPTSPAPTTLAALPYEVVLSVAAHRASSSPDAVSVASQVWCDLVADGIGLTAPVATALIQVFALAGAWRRGQRVLTDALAAGLPINAGAYLPLIRCAAVRQRDDRVATLSPSLGLDAAPAPTYADAAGLVDDMKGRGVIRTAAVYVALAAAAADFRHASEACGVVSLMAGDGLPLTPALFDHVFRACVAADRADLARAAAEMMVEGGILPSATTLGLLSTIPAKPEGSNGADGQAGEGRHDAMLASAFHAAALTPPITLVDVVDPASLPSPSPTHGGLPPSTEADAHIASSTLPSTLVVTYPPGAEGDAPSLAAMQQVVQSAARHRAIRAARDRKRGALGYGEEEVGPDGDSVDMDEVDEMVHADDGQGMVANEVAMTPHGTARAAVTQRDTEELPRPSLDEEMMKDAHAQVPMDALAAAQRRGLRSFRERPSSGGHVTFPAVVAPSNRVPHTHIRIHGVKVPIPVGLRGKTEAEARVEGVAGIAEGGEDEPSTSSPSTAHAAASDGSPDGSVAENAPSADEDDGVAGLEALQAAVRAPRTRIRIRGPRGQVFDVASEIHGMAIVGAADAGVEAQLAAAVQLESRAKAMAGAESGGVMMLDSNSATGKRRVRKAGAAATHAGVAGSAKARGAAGDGGDVVGGDALAGEGCASPPPVLAPPHKRLTRTAGAYAAATAQRWAASAMACDDDRGGDEVDASASPRLDTAASAPPSSTPPANSIISSKLVPRSRARGVQASVRAAPGLTSMVVARDPPTPSTRKVVGVGAKALASAGGGHTHDEVGGGYGAMNKEALRQLCKLRGLPLNDQYRGGNSKPTMVHRLTRYDELGMALMEPRLQSLSVEDVLARLRRFGVVMTNSSLNIYRSYNVNPLLPPDQRQKQNLLGKLKSAALDSPLVGDDITMALDLPASTSHHTSDHAGTSR